jgi:hypothetical protein
LAGIGYFFPDLIFGACAVDSRTMSLGSNVKVCGISAPSFLFPASLCRSVLAASQPISKSG